MPFKTTPRQTRLSVSIKSADQRAQVRQHLSHSGFVLPTDAIGAPHQSLAAEYPRQTGVFCNMSKSTGCHWNLHDASSPSITAEASLCKTPRAIVREIRP
jgi:hypothetical protein